MNTIKEWLPPGAAFSGQRGTSSQDILQGDTGHDLLVGGGGADALIGDPTPPSDGSQRDILIGGAGLDQFIFASRPGRGNVDVILDFKPGTDLISFAAGLFAFPELTEGEQLHSDQFKYGRKPDDHNDYVMYRQKTGTLFVDEDGTGPMPTMKLAILANKAKIDHEDFSL